MMKCAALSLPIRVGIVLMLSLSAAAQTTKPVKPKKPKEIGPPGRGSAMDYGPFLSYSVLRPAGPVDPKAPKKVYGPAPRGTKGHPTPEQTDGGELLACKGISVHVGNNATVCFDTDTLSLAGGWVGRFLELRRSHLDSDKGSVPTVVPVPLSFSTNSDPGWGNDGKFTDPRPIDGGPLPADIAQYRGLYRNGNKVVFSYSVAETSVLELDGSVAEAGHVGFTRTIRMGASKSPHQINICELEGAKGSLATVSSPKEISATRADAATSAAILSLGDDDTVVAVGGAPAGTTLEVSDNFRIQLNLPALAAPAVFKILIAKLPHADRSAFGGLLVSASTIEDPEPLCHGGPALWPDKIVTQGIRAADRAAYVIDTVRLPDENPWKSWMRTTGFDFFSDGRAAICTWNGDVWIASNLDDNLDKVTWKRFAAGLYDTLGLKIVDDQIYVLGRDQITRLHDLNGDGEADFYENFCNAWPASAVYHAFNLDFQTDSKGNFYFATCGNHATTWMRMKGVVVKVSREGDKVETIGRGLRAPNGLGIGPHDEIFCTDNQGNWIPVDRINLIKPGGFYGFPYDAHRLAKDEKVETPDHFDPPLCWIRYPNPDNSAGALIYGGKNWGPLSNQLLCTSFGKSAILGVLHEEVDGVAQGGVFKLPLKFESGVMRARVSPKDGQVWACGLGGWGETNAIHPGCFQRVRYTGKKANMPVALHILPSGIQITFSDPLDPDLAKDDQSYGIEEWNYRWAVTYGSPELKPSDPKTPGHDTVAIKKVTLSDDKKTVTLETGPLKPVMQMAIEMHLRGADESEMEWEIDNTINKIP